MVVRAAVARRLFNEATKDQVFDDEILVLEAIYRSSTPTSWHQTSTPVWPPLTAAPGIFATRKAVLAFGEIRARTGAREALNELRSSPRAALALTCSNRLGASWRPRSALTVPMRAGLRKIWNAMWDILRRDAAASDTTKPSRASQFHLLVSAALLDGVSVLSWIRDTMKWCGCQGRMIKGSDVNFLC
jgi:hypothetical protein